MGIFKTGLAFRLRDWMQSRKRPFTNRQMYEELDLPRGVERARAYKAIADFLRRGEVERIDKGKYRYNNSFQKGANAPLRAKVLKGIYVSISEFSASDIRRLTEAVDGGYVQQIIRQLVGKGYIRKVGRRNCAHGAGVETLYSIVNRDRFRIEVME